MIGSEGKRGFVFPRSSMFPEAKQRRTLRIEGKQNLLFPVGQSFSDLLYLPTQKWIKLWGHGEKKKTDVLNTAGHKFATKAHDLITCESNARVECFPRELAFSFAPGS